MKPHSFFISYSRQEAPFVDALVERLERDGNQVWADYTSLVPGKPWLEQIFAAVDQAEVFLLVVSRASMSSPNVEEEYRHALSQNKRIVLVLFETAALPTELQSREWVDFRALFRGSFKRLIKLVEQPSPCKRIPQRGFKAPALTWVSFVVSLFVVLISIPAWWTLFVPALLLPLPVQILRRNVQYYRVRFALIVLPPALLLTLAFYLSYPSFMELIRGCFVLSLVFSPVMILLLSSQEMRRWGKPGASALKFAKPYPFKKDDPIERVSFFIEHVHPDKKYADALVQTLLRHGHTQAENIEQAQVCFALISSYKNSTAIDPDHHALYPVILQDTAVEDRRIQRIQWIDFRRGMRKLDSLAHLISQPSKMLKALGVVPVGRQVIYPRIIQMVDYFLTLMGFFALSVWIPLVVEVGRDFLNYEHFGFFAVINITLTTAILLLTFFARRGLVSRQGVFSGLWRLFFTVIFVGLLGISQAVYVINIIIATVPKLTDVVDMRGTIILFMPFAFMLGFFLITLLGLWNWRDLSRWFPYRGK